MTNSAPHLILKTTDLSVVIESCLDKLEYATKLKWITDLEGPIHKVAEVGYYAFFSEKNIGATFGGGFMSGWTAMELLDDTLRLYVSEKAADFTAKWLSNFLIAAPFIMGTLDNDNVVDMVRQDPYYALGIVGFGSGMVLKAKGVIGFGKVKNTIVDYSKRLYNKLNK